MGLVAAILSSICTALMVVSDRFIIKDYYEGKSEHAWIISSAAGGVFGLALTVIIAFFLSVFTDSVSLTLISAAIYELFFWEGIAMVLVGTFAIQTLYHYFRCYENDVSSPTIASWIATLPLFIMAVYLIAEFFYPNGTEIGGVGPHWFIGIFITCFGLLAFELYTGEKSTVKSRYKHIFLYLLSSIVYVVTLRFIFTSGIDTSMGLNEIIALLPFYWLGFLAGTRPLLQTEARSNFVAAWRNRIRLFLLPIGIIEIIGMLVFYFEYLGITELNPTVVNLFIAAHIVIVYLLNLSLGFLRTKMERETVSHYSVLGFTITANALPIQKTGAKIIATETIILMIIIAGIIIAT